MRGKWREKRKVELGKGLMGVGLEGRGCEFGGDKPLTTLQAQAPALLSPLPYCPPR